jgi:hypothetical protein
MAGNTENTEKKKAPMATWLIATVVVGLLIMLVIGIIIL